MSSDPDTLMRRFSPRRSIAGKVYLLVGGAFAASALILLASVLTMEVSKATTTMLKGERDHTVHLYGALHDFDDMVISRDPETERAALRDLDLALNLSGTFGSSLELLRTRSIDDVAEQLSSGSPSMTFEEARQLFKVVRVMASNPRVTYLLAKAEEVHSMGQEFRSEVEAFLSAQSPEEEARIQDRAAVLSESMMDGVLEFNAGATDLEHWATRLAGRILWGGFLLILVGGLFLSWRIVSSVDRSLGKVVGFSEVIAGGDFSQRLDAGASDETAVLARSMNRICENLQGMMARIAGGASTVSSSLSQISSTASELAATSSQTSSAVTEISTTLEELRHTSHVSNERAGDVAGQAEDMAAVASTGRGYLEETIAGMQHIREEMEYVAESIIRLTEQNESIEGIIDVVNDLADQSNLLSVNASIEAAKAGEQGRGFQVVAQEMRSLADRSKDATQEVKGILKDIQTATGAAVMATERGTKAVDKGVNLSGQAGETIGALADAMAASADSASQIAAAIQQQLLGLDQLVEAMESIKDASAQNLDGTRQLEAASSDLSELGGELVELSGRFKV